MSNNAATIIGVDAGATWIKATKYTSALAPIASTTVVSGATQGSDAYFASIAQVVQELGPAQQVGLALPGTFTPQREGVRYMANVVGREMGQPVLLLADIAKKIGVTTASVVAENDAGCAALGEWQQGRGQANVTSSLLHLTWGTGIGTGLVSNGVSQFGWEGGHLPVTWDEEAPLPCNCGSKHDLEAFVAVPHLVARAEKMFTQGQFTTDLTRADFVDPRETSKRLLALAEQGDELAQLVVDEALRWLARGLHMMAILTYPTLVTIGGGMMGSPWLLERLRQAVAQQASGFLKDALPPDIIFPAQLGNDAGMLGAAILARQKLQN